MPTNSSIILIASIFVAGVAGYLGSLMLSRKMTIIADPLSHLALPGVALALILQKDVSFGAFLFLFLGTILIWYLQEKTKLPTETIIAILFSVSLAITFLFLSEHQIEEALMGDISKIDFLEGIIIIFVCLSVFLLLRKIYPKLILISISEEIAQSEGVNLKKYNFLYLLAISAIIALGVKFVGGLLVSALVALPAATAKNLVKNLKNYQILSSFFGISFVLLSYSFFRISHFSFGPLIIISGFFVFLISLILKKWKRFQK